VYEFTGESRTNVHWYIVEAGQVSMNQKKIKVILDIHHMEHLLVQHNHGLIMLSNHPAGKQQVCHHLA
jgi:hypothetical protein